RLVALAPGKYWVKRRLVDHLRVGEISVSAGAIAVIDDAELKNADFSDDPVKGAYQTLTYSRHWSVALDGAYQFVFDKPLDQGGYFPSAPQCGLDVTLHNAFGRGWSVGFDGTYGWASGNLLLGTADLIPYAYNDLVIGATGLHEWPEGFWVPFVG